MSVTPEEVVAVQHRTVRILLVSQAVGALGITIGVSTASLLARDISGSDQQAGLVQTFQVLGASAASYLLARLMSARGRRVGLAVGLAVGAAGAGLAVAAGVVGSMPLLLVGAALLGSTTAANAGSRYAATDLADATTRARALSTVVWATTLGAVVGPNLSGPAGALARVLGIPELTGPFLLGAVGMLASAAIITVRLRPDPLLTARAVAGAAEPPHGTRSWQRAVAAIRADPGLLGGVVALASAHAVMISVMIMTPLHMEHGGAELRVIGFVISVHVLGMFAFSPAVGWLADRIGRRTTLVLGAAVLMASLLLSGRSPAGSSWQIFGGLFLLGLGWSLCTIAASAVIADRAPLQVRTDVQGLSDVAMGLTAAAAGALSGLVVGAWDYAGLTVFAAVLTLGVLGAASLGDRTEVAA